MLLHILSLIKRIVASNINYPHRWRRWEGRVEEVGGRGVSSVIRFSALFEGSMRRRAHFTAIKITEEGGVRRDV